VLICEPHDDISALLEVVVRRLGHDAVVWRGNDSDLVGVAAAVVEPGEAEGIRVAKRLRSDDVPVLFASIFPADDEMLALEPRAYLVKPFPLYVLERALAEALGTQGAPRVAAAAG
jgi:DNA-binding response OmpR family regulator